MSYYAVVMGQAVVSSNLLQDKLGTGVLSSDSIYTCSAVVMVNTTSYKGGIFHFPAGSIYDREEYKSIADEMYSLISPDRSFVIYGQDFTPPRKEEWSETPEDFWRLYGVHCPFNTGAYELQHYLRSKIGHCGYRPAAGGVVVQMKNVVFTPPKNHKGATSYLQGGQVELLKGSDIEEKVIDLSKDEAGDYGSYVLLGKGESFSHYKEDN